MDCMGWNRGSRMDDDGQLHAASDRVPTLKGGGANVFVSSGTARRYLRGRNAYMELGCVCGCNILEWIIVARHLPTTETDVVL